MYGGGIIWGAIICIPFWLFIIWLIKIGVISLEILIFVGLNLSGLLLFLILRSRYKTKQNNQYWDTFIKNLPDASNQSKTRTEALSETDTPA